MFKEDLIIVYYYFKVKFNLIPKIMWKRKKMNLVSVAQLKGKGWLQAIKHQIQTNLFQLRDGDSWKRTKCYVSHMFSLFGEFVTRCHVIMQHKLESKYLNFLFILFTFKKKKDITKMIYIKRVNIMTSWKEMNNKCIRRKSIAKYNFDLWFFVILFSCLTHVR